MSRPRRIANVPNWPVCSAYAGTATAVPSATHTKVTLNTEDIDTEGSFLNSRFTPQVAGYYQVNASVQFDGTGVAAALCSIYKNGTQARISSYQAGAVNSPVCNVSALIYLNGKTDYIEMFAYHTTGSSVNTIASALSTFFQACLVRPAE